MGAAKGILERLETDRKRRNREASQQADLDRLASLSRQVKNLRGAWRSVKETIAETEKVAEDRIVGRVSDFQVADALGDLAARCRLLAARANELARVAEGPEDRTDIGAGADMRAALQTESPVVRVPRPHPPRSSHD